VVNLNHSTKFSNDKRSKECYELQRDNERFLIFEFKTSEISFMKSSEKLDCFNSFSNDSCVQFYQFISRHRFMDVFNACTISSKV
jgi:hypothetical protein